jgi:hypothetical protein
VIFIRQLILIFAANPPLRSHVFCRNTHMAIVEWIGQRTDHHIDDL